MAGKRLSARPLASTELEAYDRLARVHGCLFDTVRWTGLFEPDIRRMGLYDGGDNLRGGFCLYEQRRAGLVFVRNSPFTPHVGPFFEYRATNAAARTDEQREVVDAMAACLSERGGAVTSFGLSLDVHDCLPFYWRGYRVVPRYTYRVDLRRTDEEILAGMSAERRKNITKARKDGLEVSATEDPREVRDLVDGTFGRQGKAFPRRAMDRILSSFPPGSDSFAYVTRSGGKPIAGVYVVHDDKVAYYVMGGYDSRHSHHGAGAIAMYHAIVRAREAGMCAFDFEGSMVPAIETYFRGFGGTLVPFFGVHRAWLPLEMILKLKYRQLF